jgi:SAM-dependent methyltransferase
MRGPVGYDDFGGGYSTRRVTDPRIAMRISTALDDARTVLNVGAGAGSYEPADRVVIAVEPSAVMAAQRPQGTPPAVLASAEKLPFVDDAFDGSMAILTLHHWADPRLGLVEMRRVTRTRAVILTFEPELTSNYWLFADYIPFVADAERRQVPSTRLVSEWLGGEVTVEAVPIPHDCRDGFLLSFWRRPEALLDPAARAATSAFATMAPDLESEVIEALERDLGTGRWDERYGYLRELEEFDVGLRLITADWSPRT